MQYNMIEINNEMNSYLREKAYNIQNSWIFFEKELYKTFSRSDNFFNDYLLIDVKTFCSYLINTIRETQNDWKAAELWAAAQSEYEYLSQTRFNYLSKKIPPIINRVEKRI